MVTYYIARKKSRSSAEFIAKLTASDLNGLMGKLSDSDMFNEKIVRV